MTPDDIREVLRFVKEVPIDTYAHNWIYNWKDKVVEILENSLPH